MEDAKRIKIFESFIEIVGAMIMSITIVKSAGGR